MVCNPGSYSGNLGQIPRIHSRCFHVVQHLGMTEGMDTNWSFGSSILDPNFQNIQAKRTA